MNILLLTQVLPFPPDSGPKVKTFHVIRYLAERGHRVTLASFVRRSELDHVKGIEPYCAEIHTVQIRRSGFADVRAYLYSLYSGLPFIVTRDASKEMSDLVKQLAANQCFDIIHADQLSMGQYALGSNSACRVFDAHNAVWEILQRSSRDAPWFMRPVIAAEARRLKKYEGDLCRQMDAVLAVSEADRQALVQAGAEGSKIKIIPIAIDTRESKPIARRERAKNILITGTLFYPPTANAVRWFLHDVFPFVLTQCPEVTLTIVGPRPPKDFLGASHVIVTGYVPDLMPYLERATVMVVPVRAASGMRVRILEAFARGIPVVTTTTGAEGIDATSGEHLLIADEPREFANAVLRLLVDNALGERLARSARVLVETQYDWREVLPRLETVYKSLSNGVA